MEKKVFRRGNLFFFSGVLTLLNIPMLGDANGTDREREPLSPGRHHTALTPQERANENFNQQIQWNTTVRRITGGTTYFLAGIATTFATLSTQSSDPVRKDIFGWITVGAGIGVLLAKSIETCLIGPQEQAVDRQVARALEEAPPPAPTGVRQHAAGHMPPPTLAAMATALQRRSELCRL